MASAVYQRNWRQEHPDSVRAFKRKWRRANPVKAARHEREWRWTERKRVLKMLGGKCVQCGYDNLVALDFDHIADDGRFDVQGNRVFSVKRQPERFQVLCKNCNWIKEWRRRNAEFERKTASLDGSGGPRLA